MTNPALSLDLRGKWAQQPMEVNMDKGLSHAAKSLHVAMRFDAWQRGGNICRATYEMLAALSGSSKSTVMRCMPELIARRIVIPAKGNKERAAMSWHLSIPNSIAAPVVPMLQCSACHASRKRLTKSGICKGCSIEVEDEKRMRRALMELGNAAADDEIAHYCQIDKITPRWLRIRRKVEHAA